MKKGKKGWIGFLCLLLLIPGVSTLAASRGQIVKKIDAAFQTKTPYPIISSEIEGLTVDQAYAIQKEFVQLEEKNGEVVMGFKAGLTAKAAQNKFGLTEAVRGTLFQSMLRWPGTIYRKDFSRMFIETEIGFRFGKAINGRVQDIETLKKAVSIVFPAIELPDVSYADMKSLKGVDLIATNVAARKVLIGKAVNPVGRDLNAVSVNLFHNGKKIGSGLGKNALGDQWEALKWTVNDVLSRSEKIENGFVIITGSLTKLMPAKPGTYVADYGSFGKISFEFK